MRTSNSASIRLPRPGTVWATAKPGLTVTSVNLERLQTMLETHSEPRDKDAMELLEADLARAQVVRPEDIPVDIVTMNTCLQYFVETTGFGRVVTLAYPSDADSSAGWESVLAPVGCSVLGLTNGQVIEWPRPDDGKTVRITVSGILYQPESCGAYHL